MIQRYILRTWTFSGPTVITSDLERLRVFRGWWKLQADVNSMARFQPTGGDRKHQVLAVTIMHAVHLGRLCVSGCWRVCVVAVDSYSLCIPFFTADSWKCLWVELIFFAARFITAVYPIAFYSVNQGLGIFEILFAVTIDYHEWRSEHDDDAR